MANIIKIKRKPLANGAGVPSTLQGGELAFSEANAIMYYGLDSGGGVSPIEIAGSGYVLAKISDNAPTKTGGGASGTWNISISGNSNTVTSGVYTSRQIDSGSGLVGGGNLSADRTFNIGQGDGLLVNADNVSVDSSVFRTSGTQITTGLKIFRNSLVFGSGFTSSGNTTITASTTNSAVTHFPIFISDPNSTSQQLYSRAPSGIKFDLSLNNVENLALSGISFTAGSGMVGGGNLSANRTFDIGQGDGISVGADNISVNGTVVRTTGNQTISGQKTFSNTIVLNSGVSVYNGVSLTNATDTANLNVYQTSLNSSTIYFDTDDSNLHVAYKSGGLSQFGYTLSSNLITNSGATDIPNGSAVVNYVSSAINSGIATNDAMIFKGVIDCSTNPNYPAADRGWTYKVSVAGKIGGASGPAVEVNDTLICSVDASPTGTHASVGGNWVILQTNIADASILVTGPTSATSNNLAIFDGSTGKSIKDNSISISNVVLTTGTQTISSPKDFGGNLKITAANTLSAEYFPTFGSDDPTSTSRTLQYITKQNLVNALSFETVDLGNSFVTTTGNQQISGVKTFLSYSRFNGNIPTISSRTDGFYPFGNIELQNSGSNFIVFNSYGSGFAPTASTSFSSGTKIIFRPAPLATVPPAAIGLNDRSLWYVVPGNNWKYEWNAFNSTIATLYGDGTFNATNISGTNFYLGGTKIDSSASDLNLLDTAANGQLLIGSGTAFAKSLLTAGTNISITNAAGSITINSTDTNTATAADNILDGSNNGTEITYAPYTSNQAASASPRFYNTNDNPTATNRLNLSAYFYATRLYDNGHRVVTTGTVCSDIADCTVDGGTFI